MPFTYNVYTVPSVAGSSNFRGFFASSRKRLPERRVLDPGPGDDGGHPQPPNPQPQRKGRGTRTAASPMPPLPPQGPGLDFGRHGVPKGAVTRSGALPKSRGYSPPAPPNGHMGPKARKRMFRGKATRGFRGV